MKAPIDHEAARELAAISRWFWIAVALQLLVFVVILPALAPSCWEYNIMAVPEISWPPDSATGSGAPSGPSAGGLFFSAKAIVLSAPFLVAQYAVVCAARRVIPKLQSAKFLLLAILSILLAQVLPTILFGDRISEAFDRCSAISNSQQYSGGS